MQAVETPRVQAEHIICVSKIGLRTAIS